MSKIYEIVFNTPQWDGGEREIATAAAVTHVHLLPPVAAAGTLPFMWKNLTTLSTEPVPTGALSSMLSMILVLLSLVSSINPAQTTRARKPAGHAASHLARSRQTRTSLSAREIFVRSKPYVYTLRTASAQGTGFIAAGFGLLTCFHVVHDANMVVAEQMGRRPLRLTRLISIDQDADLVALISRDLSMKGLPIGNSSRLAIGDPLYVVGSPNGLELTLTEGILSARRTEAGIEYLQISAATSPGSSGSPVLNQYGEFVGIVSAQIKDAQQLNFAVSTATMFSRFALGVPLARVSTQQPATVGSLEPGELSEVIGAATTLRPLASCPSFKVSVHCSGIDAVVLPPNEVRTWVLSELARSAPGARVVDAPDQSETSKHTGLLHELFRLDGIARGLHLEIYCCPDPDHGLTFYSILLGLNRGAYLPSGGAIPTVWSDGAYGYFGFNQDPSAILRRPVEELVKKFADQWSIENR